MKHTITYLELLQMLQKGKQPKRIFYDDKIFIFYEDVYVEESSLNKKIRYFMTEAIELQTEYYLATEKIFIYQDEILDDKEKEYLSNVIKPFRKKVCSLSKIRYTKNYECIVIGYVDCDEDGVELTFMDFPSFPKGTMYKGMELNKEYTLEELWL